MQTIPLQQQTLVHNAHEILESGVEFHFPLFLGGCLALLILLVRFMLHGMLVVLFFGLENSLFLENLLGLQHLVALLDHLQLLGLLGGGLFGSGLVVGRLIVGRLIVGRPFVGGIFGGGLLGGGGLALFF